MLRLYLGRKPFVLALSKYEHHSFSALLKKEHTMPPRKQPVETQIYQLKITLKDSKPPIWRRVQVPSDVSLGKLHRIIQEAMGWSDYHLHQFRLGETYYGVPDPDDF